MHLDIQQSLDGLRNPKYSLVYILLLIFVVQPQLVRVDKSFQLVDVRQSDQFGARRLVGVHMPLCEFISFYMHSCIFSSLFIFLRTYFIYINFWATHFLDLFYIDTIYGQK